jgi:hypothetical protein
MRRRDISGVLFGTAAGAMLLPKSSEAQASTYPPLDIRRYNPGPNDATAAFNAAFAAAAAQGGGEVFVPAGTWTIKQALALPFNTSLKGEGRLVSLIKIDGPFVGITVTAPQNDHVSSQAHTRIEGIGFVGTTVAEGALCFERVNWIVVRDCAFRDFSLSTGFGIEMLHCFNWQIEHCYFENIMAYGVKLLSEDVIENNAPIRVGCNHGIFGPNNDVNGNNMAIFIGIAVEVAQNVVITGNNFEGSGSGRKAVDLRGSDGVWICGNYIEHWVDAAITATSGWTNSRLFVMENVIHARNTATCYLDNSAPNDNVVFALNRFPDLRPEQIAVNVGSTTNFCEFNNDSGVRSITESYSRSCITARALQASVTWAPSVMVSGAVVAVNVNVPGAAVGDTCLASFDQLGANNVMISSHVSAANTVRVMLLNQEATMVGYAAGTLNVKVFK